MTKFSKFMTDVYTNPSSDDKGCFKSLLKSQRSFAASLLSVSVSDLFQDPLVYFTDFIFYLTAVGRKFQVRWRKTCGNGPGSEDHMGPWSPSETAGPQLRGLGANFVMDPEVQQSQGLFYIFTVTFFSSLQKFYDVTPDKVNGSRGDTCNVTVLKNHLI